MHTARALKSLPTNDFKCFVNLVPSRVLKPEKLNATRIDCISALCLVESRDIKCLSKYLYGPSKIECKTSTGVPLKNKDER